ncbi:MAG: chloramphenicol resistance protein [Bacilli bacterium]
MTTIESVRNYIKECPHLSEFHKGINVNYLGEEDDSYCIEETPANPIIKKYIDGSTVRRFLFVFASKEAFGQDVMQNIENSGFYEKFATWLEEESNKGNLPILGKGKEARKIQANTNGYLFNAEMDRASYQIQLELIYYQQK